MRALFVLLLFTTNVSHAQKFHRCVGADGAVTFSDVTCPKTVKQNDDSGESMGMKYAAPASQDDQGATAAQAQSPNKPQTSKSSSVAQR